MVASPRTTLSALVALRTLARSVEGGPAMDDIAEIVAKRRADPDADFPLSSRQERRSHKKRRKLLFRP